VARRSGGADFQPFPYGARSEPSLSGHVADRGACVSQGVDLRLPGQVSMLRDVASVAGTRGGHHHFFIVGFRQQGSPR